MTGEVETEPVSEIAAAAPARSLGAAVRMTSFVRVSARPTPMPNRADRSVKRTIVSAVSNRVPMTNPTITSDRPVMITVRTETVRARTGASRVPTTAATAPWGAGATRLHVAVDDFSRVAYAELLPDERNCMLDAEGKPSRFCYALPVTIGSNIWFGANVTVCGGVTIGDNCVIGAGSVVTRDIPAGSLAAGVPCRVIRPITEADSMAYKPEILADNSVIKK